MTYFWSENGHLQPEDREVATTGGKFRRFFAPAKIRLLVLLAITGVFAFWGYSLLSPESYQSPSSQQAEYAATPPTIFLGANSQSLKAVITRAVLSPSSLSIDLRVTAPPGGGNMPDELWINVYGGEDYIALYPWIKKINVAPGTSTQHFHVPFTECFCYQYTSPYLTAEGVNSYGSEASGLPASSLPDFGPTYKYTISPVIEQDVLDLSDADIGGGVFNLSTSSYPSVQQIGPATWQWQDVRPSDPVSFTAESVSGKNDADTQVFQAGILLGIAGSAFIIVVDHGFDIWRERKERNDKRNNKGIPGQGIALISARGTVVTIPPPERRPNTEKVRGSSPRSPQRRSDKPPDQP